MGKENENVNPADADYEQVSTFADRLGLDDEQREKFVNSSMKRLGYKPRTSWDPPEQEDGGKGKGDEDFFSGGKPREQRQVRPDGNQQRQGSGAGWQYE